MHIMQGRDDPGGRHDERAQRLCMRRALLKGRMMQEEHKGGMKVEDYEGRGMMHDGILKGRDDAQGRPYEMEE